MRRLARTLAASILLLGACTPLGFWIYEDPVVRVHRVTLEALESGTYLFAVRGRATFRTPIGVREVRFAQQGSMVFGQRSSIPSP